MNKDNYNEYLGVNLQTEIKDCPFCGGMLYTKDRECYYHDENDCFLSGQICIDDNMDDLPESAKQWNTRVGNINPIDNLEIAKQLVKQLKDREYQILSRNNQAETEYDIVVIADILDDIFKNADRIDEIRHERGE